MDIIITDSSLRKFLETPADSDTLRQNISLCGPTFDRVNKTDNDYIYEIEVITNRIDTGSAQGIAREATAILTQFGIPAKMLNNPYKDKIAIKAGLPKQFHFTFEENLALRFTAIALESITVKPSPQETQTLLSNCGQRPISNCVDITNELTLLYGMPSHIFDLDKLGAQKLHLRLSKADETIITIDGKENKLRGEDIVIEDATGKLVDLCGVMGGQAAEVDDHTKNILLIVPVYDPKKIRKTSLYLQNRTMAAQIYEKQPDPELCLPVISKAIQLFKERTGAEVSSTLFDYYPTIRLPKVVSLDFDWLNSFVGISLKREIVISILDNLGFAGTIDKDKLVCMVPSWRHHDINIKEDLAEEVARIYGYFHLPPVLPCVNLPPEAKNPLLETELTAKKYLSNKGFHEVYNSSLVSLSLLEKTEQDPKDHLKLQNALSSDYEYLRTTLTPSSLENHKNNQGKVDCTLKTYEVANTYQRVSGQDLPSEVSTLAILSGANYRETKGELEALLDYLKIPDISFKVSQDPPVFFDTTSTADIYSDQSLLGHIGLLKPVVLRNIGLQSIPTAVELNLSALSSKENIKYDYHPISDFPSILEDITISSNKSIGEIIDTIKPISTLITNIQYLGSYQNKHTFRVTFGSYSKNLEQKDINILKDSIQEHFQA